MGLKSISLDAMFITLHDSCLLNRSAKISQCGQFTVITLEFLIFLTDFNHLLMCLGDFILDLELFTLLITIRLSQLIRIACSGFSTKCKSINSSRNSSASTIASAGAPVMDDYGWNHTLKACLV